MDAKEANKEYFAQKRKTAEDESTKDLAKSNKQLLDDIHDESLAVPQERPPELTVARTMARFASLLHNLSRQGSETADKNLEIAKINLDISKANLRFQRWIIGLTIVILILTFFSALPVFQKIFGFEDGSATTNQKTNAPTQTK